MSKRIFYEAPLVSDPKRCPRCGETRTVGDFVVDRSKRGGRGSLCRECDRERAREYYAANRDAVLARAAAKREPRPPAFCSECGVQLEGRQRVICGKSGCRDRRFRRLHPDAYAERERQKVVRRRERRRAAGS